MKQHLRRAGAMLYVVVTAAVIAVATSAMLRMSAVSNHVVSESEDKLEAEALIEHFNSYVYTLLTERRLPLNWFPTWSGADYTTSLAVTDNSAIVPGTVLVVTTCIYKEKTYRRTEVFGVPSELPTVSGLWGNYWQTNGTNSWWVWPPSLLSEPEAPRFARVDRTLNFPGGPTMTFMPQAPSPYVEWTGVIIAPESGNYTFSGSADNCWGLWIGGHVLQDAFYGGFGHDGYDDGPRTVTNTRYLHKGDPVTIRILFMDYGGWGSFSLRWQTPSNANLVAIPASAFQPAGYIGGRRSTWAIPVNPKGVYATAQTWDAVHRPTAIDLQSMGFYPGERIRLRSVGGWNAWSSGNDFWATRSMYGIFSTTPDIDPDQTKNNRVTGSVPVPGESSPVNPYLDTDHDFVITWQGNGGGTGWSAETPKVFTIPPGARYLFVQGADSAWSDNRHSTYAGPWTLIVERE